MVNKKSTAVIARAFLALLIVNTVFCPCRGIAKILSTGCQTEEVCCDRCCAHEEPEAPIPSSGDDNCDCQDGCCGDFLVPKAGDDLSAETPAPTFVAVARSEPAAILFSVSSIARLKLPSHEPFGGSLYEGLAALLI